MADVAALAALTSAVRAEWAAESRAAAQRLRACYELLRECLRQDEAAAVASRPGHAVVDPFDVASGQVVSATGVSDRRAATMLNFSWDLHERFPAVLAALSAGRMEVRAAEVLVRQMELVDHEVLPLVQELVVEQYLAALEAGERLGLRAIRERVDEIISCHDADGLRRRADEAARARGVRLDKGADGMSTVRATLHSDEAAVLAEAIDSRASELAEAEAEAAERAAAAAEAAGEAAPIREDLSYPMVQRRADALLSLVCGDSLADQPHPADEPHPTDGPHSADRPLGAGGGPVALRPRVTVIAGGGGYDDDEAGGARVEFTRTGEASLQALLDMLAESDGASFERVDPRIGAADDADRALTYRPGAALARRVRLRDGTCRHPGCSVPADACDLDHVVPFDHADPARGGRTEESNLVDLCRRHHRFKTFSDWTYELQPDGTLVVTTADGAVMLTRPSGPLATYRREQAAVEAEAWRRQQRRNPDPVTAAGRDPSEPTYSARRAARLAAERARSDGAPPGHPSRWRQRNHARIAGAAGGEAVVSEVEQDLERLLADLLDPPPF